MSIDDTDQLRTMIAEQEETIRALHYRLNIVYETIRAHREVKHNTIPVGGFHRCDKSLWELLEDN